jgi:hypothetical protein
LDNGIAKKNPGNNELLEFWKDGKTKEKVQRKKVKGKCM